MTHARVAFEMEAGRPASSVASLDAATLWREGLPGDVSFSERFLQVSQIDVDLFGVRLKVR